MQCLYRILFWNTLWSTVSIWPSCFRASRFVSHCPRHQNVGVHEGWWGASGASDKLHYLFETGQKAKDSALHSHPQSHPWTTALTFGIHIPPFHHFSPLLLRGTDKALVQAVRFFGTKPLAVKYSSWPRPKMQNSCWLLTCFFLSDTWPRDLLLTTCKVSLKPFVAFPNHSNTQSALACPTWVFAVISWPWCIRILIGTNNRWIMHT